MGVSVVGAGRASLLRARSWRERALSALAVLAVGLAVSRLTLHQTPFHGSVIAVWQLLPFALPGASAFVMTSRGGTIAGLTLMAAATAAGNLTIGGAQTSTAAAYVLLPVLLTVGVLVWVLGDLVLAFARGGLRAHRSAA